MATSNFESFQNWLYLQNRYRTPKAIHHLVHNFKIPYTHKDNFSFDGFFPRAIRFLDRPTKFPALTSTGTISTRKRLLPDVMVNTEFLTRRQSWLVKFIYCNVRIVFINQSMTYTVKLIIIFDEYY